MEEEDEEVVVVVVALLFKVVRAEAISVFIFLLSRMYPSITVVDFHWPCLFRFSMDTPESARTVADVARKLWPVYSSGFSRFKKEATMNGIVLIVFIPIGEFLKTCFFLSKVNHNLGLVQCCRSSKYLSYR